MTVSYRRAEAHLRGTQFARLSSMTSLMASRTRMLMPLALSFISRSSSLSTCTPARREGSELLFTVFNVWLSFGRWCQATLRSPHHSLSGVRAKQLRLVPSSPLRNPSVRMRQCVYSSSPSLNPPLRCLPRSYAVSAAPGAPPHLV